jgi:hypothetical protein
MLWGWPFSTWELIVKGAIWLAAITGIFAAISAFIAGYVGYELTDAIQKQSDLQIAQARSQGDVARAEAAKANERAAEANAQAEEAKLALEKLKMPRTLGPMRQQFVAAAVSAFKGQQYRTAISQGADDGLAFWESLYVTLKKAGWVYLPASGIFVGNPPAGVPVAAIPGVEIELDPTKENELSAPALALGNALHADGTVVAVNRAAHTNPNEADRDILMIVIGARVPPP